MHLWKVRSKKIVYEQFLLITLNNTRERFEFSEIWGFHGGEDSYCDAV
jgi:hypothetical protein